LSGCGSRRQRSSVTGPESDNMAKILLIDDNDDLTYYLRAALEKEGHQVQSLERAERGLEELDRENFDLVLLDNKMEGMSGIDFLGALRKRDMHIPVILMTGYGTSKTAIEAMRQGAFDYVIKPLSYDELLAKLQAPIAEALRIAQSVQLRVRLPGKAAGADTFGPQLEGNSEPMQEVYKRIGLVAAHDLPVLIRGETGTGKDLVAKAIHDYSPRKDRPFVAINCTAFNANMLEDELFGHEPNAFTGADKVKLRKGRFEYANGGTLFLDEIGDMPVDLQPKLLRVLDQKAISRIGSNETIAVDVRVLSATHRDLKAAIEEGKFREDLYYRLNGLSVRLPPLRERGPDLQQLAEYFLTRANQETGRPVPVLHPSALAKLRGHAWKGNIRELKQVIEAARVVCGGPQLLPEHLDLGETEPNGPVQGPRESRTDCQSVQRDRTDCQSILRECEAVAALQQAFRWAWSTGQDKLYELLHDLLKRELVHFALAELNGNKAQAARRLGISRNSVTEWEKPATP
jgi:two-component system response regulator HydG